MNFLDIIMSHVLYLINMLNQSEVYGTNSQHEQTFYIELFHSRLF